jgi:hypothetical protein
MLYFNSRYFFVSLGLLAVLVFIAVVLNDRIIRPFVGDVLVVIWMFSFLKSFLRLGLKPLLISVVSFAYAVEIGQFFNFINIIGLQQFYIARIVLGATFDWFDMLAYSLGGLIILYSELRFNHTVTN